VNVSSGTSSPRLSRKMVVIVVVVTIFGRYHPWNLVFSVHCRNASLHEKLFLRAVLAEFARTGIEEAVFRCVYKQHVSLCRFDGASY